MIPSNFITQQNTRQGHSCFYYGFYVPFYFDDTKVYLGRTQKQVIWSSEAQLGETSPLANNWFLHTGYKSGSLILFFEQTESYPDF